MKKWTLWVKALAALQDATPPCQLPRYGVPVDYFRRSASIGPRGRVGLGVEATGCVLGLVKACMGILIYLSSGISRAVNRG